MHDHIESAKEMLDNLTVNPSYDEKFKSRPIVYWANCLCDALEHEVIDAELVAQCIQNIREYS